jgi:hypothetical protein
MALPTIQVLDGAGATRTVSTANSGRQAAADSASVVFSTEDKATFETVPVMGRTTREYAIANGLRVAIGAASARVGPVTFGATREVRFRVTSACYLKWGDGTVAAGVDALSYPMDANSSEVLVIPVGATHIAVIQETAGGFLNVTPVA